MGLLYVQYYEMPFIGTWTKTFPPYLHEAIGDRAVIVLDARERVETHHEIAVECNGVNRPQYAAYRLMAGSSFIDSQPISPMVDL